MNSKCQSKSSWYFMKSFWSSKSKINKRYIRPKGTSILFKWELICEKAFLTCTLFLSFLYTLSLPLSYHLSLTHTHTYHLSFSFTLFSSLSPKLTLDLSLSLSPSLSTLSFFHPLTFLELVQKWKGSWLTSFHF